MNGMLSMSSLLFPLKNYFKRKRISTSSHQLWKFVSTKTMAKNATAENKQFYPKAIVWQYKRKLLNTQEIKQSKNQ